MKYILILLLFTSFSVFASELEDFIQVNQDTLEGIIVMYSQYKKINLQLRPPKIYKQYSDILDRMNHLYKQLRNIQYITNKRCKKPSFNSVYNVLVSLNALEKKFKILKNIKKLKRNHKNTITNLQTEYLSEIIFNYKNSIYD